MIKVLLKKYLQSLLLITQNKKNKAKKLTIKSERNGPEIKKTTREEAIKFIRVEL